MHRYLLLTVAVLALSGLMVSSAASKPNATDGVHLVAYAKGVSARDARAAIERLGGTILSENRALGYAKVSSESSGFLAGVRGSSALAGAARDRVIATAEPGYRPKDFDIERLSAERQASLGLPGVADVAPSATGEPLAEHWQWDMRMIHATASESYAVEPGKSAVLVGIMDTGIDAAHPDIAPNFNGVLSRNFTTDIELIDGKCAQEPDKSCSDPATVDENSHGTHVAGTVASPINGLGMAGVAPGVTLVNIRAGQDSGFFFLFETLAAYTYAADNGIDVVNMSFFTDPWWANCPANPLDSLEEQIEQRAIISLSNEALDYAYDYPPGEAKIRDNITNDCLVIPTEGNHVISVSALGSTGRKAYYSNYGLEQTVVSAPGGDRREFFGTELYNTPGLRVLSSYPAELAMKEKLITRNFKVRDPLAVVDCETGQPKKGTCGVYVYLQGTSMASPHAVGVAALIISAIGSYDPVTGEFGADPAAVEAALRSTATNADDFFSAIGEDWRDFCPEPPTLFHYDDPTLPVDPPDWDALCEGDADVNGFYGDGVVNALEAAGL
jgi:lantibiotic leader peptide-processing serine protease